MSSNAIESQGVTIARLEGTVYTDIPEIKSFNGPGGSATVIDVTDLQSTAKEKRMGLPDEGQLQFTINYIPDNSMHQALRADRASREEKTFRITFTDASPATTWTFDGFVLNFVVSGAVDGVVEAQVTIEITGAITEA